MIRWNLEVRRWNDSPAKNAAGESSGVALESLFPHENGALESFSDFLESWGWYAGTFLPQKMQRWNPSVFRWNPDSRKIMGRWNPPVFRWNLIPAKK